MNNKRIFYLAFILIIFSCELKNHKKIEEIKSEYDNSLNNVKKPKSEVDSVVTKNVFPRFSYKINFDKTTSILKSVLIYSDKNKIQEISINKKIYENNFQLIDWNFDGFKDISIIDNCGSGGCSYLIWNYSPKNKEYHYNKELSEIIGLKLDTNSKQIIINYRAGHSEENYDTMKYINNKLQQISSQYITRWNDSDGNLWIKKTSKKFINNKVIISSDSSIVK